MISRFALYLLALVLLVVAAAAAAQRSMSDSDLLRRRDSSGLSRDDSRRFGELKDEESKRQAEDLALRQKLLRLPPLPVERNVLLGNWRLDGGDPQGRAFEQAVPRKGKMGFGDLRIDLRGSACDDPRAKATLYDFDANGMLQSITCVWERPAGPAPAPIFTERVTQLSRFHSRPPPQSPGRVQADTSLGRLVLQDMPERNVLLEAYAAKK